MGLFTKSDNSKLGKYLSPLSVWALSFGCAVGWGSFVMPGTTFLPGAGPLGTAIGISIGAVIMLIIGMNYHYLLNRYPDSGGTLTYASKLFGYDHGYLSAWFLILVYFAIIWANATAITLVSRYLLGGIFQFGFHYQVLGYDVYFGEVLLTMGVILLAGFLCMIRKRAAIAVQVLCALMLLGGVVFCAITLVSTGAYGSTISDVQFAPTEKSHMSQILTIMALSPWAFVGFESISNSVEGFKFNPKKTIWIIIISVFTSALTYILLNYMATSAMPDGYANWSEYVADLGAHSGTDGLPVFFGVDRVMGTKGLVILGVAALCGVLTGLIGNFIAASRLIHGMALDDILPKPFSFVNSDGSPANAIFVIMIVSLVIPFFGRTAIGWIIDVNTIGAVVAYGYTSAAAIAQAKKESDIVHKITGVIGLAMSVFFFFYFMVWTSNAMSTESYLILAAWSVLGFFYFRHVFENDQKKRFGKSTIVWIGLLFLIFFTSLMWVNQANEDLTKNVIVNVSEYYEEMNQERDPDIVNDTEEYLHDQVIRAERLQIRNSFIQMALIVVSLGIMFSIYSIMTKRQRETEREKITAEENSRAKSTFLTNMSHDIRTPMNAILGYINIAKKEGTTFEKTREYLDKIEGSSNHLLALINDILEMSRIENGRLELEETETDLVKVMDDMRDMFENQMNRKNIKYTVDCSGVRDRNVMCDKNRINRMLINLIGNAQKFTNEGGSVDVVLSQLEKLEEDKATYRLCIKDSGIGMSREFAEHVFEAFEREKTSTVSGIQGTGLGMAITKSIVDLMGGDIQVKSESGVGTEFVITVPLTIVSSSMATGFEHDNGAESAVIDFTNMRILLVEDMEINREIATMLLNSEGFMVETAVNGKEAVDQVLAHDAGYYDAVFMDVQMPVMDGYEATRQIRAISDPERAAVPILAMTANAFTEDVKKALDAGMDEHISKPIDMASISEKLTQVLRSKGRH